ncbi:MAG: bifunctional metallophosphatase/5'-nucleotidase [Ignavibacteriales bacterium]|nr:bifunctional metallophosphatase/5'-nucleotidase [Ignavibacteriales bacterium]
MKIFSLLFFYTASLFAQNTNLRILHWNDFHTQNLPYQVKTKNRTTNKDTSFLVGGSATLASYLKKYHSGDTATLLLNAGDDFQGSPISTITKGSSQIQLLNLLKPHAMTLGNHEFDYGRNSLTEILRSATFPVVSANLFDHGSNSTYVKRYIIQQIGSIKVGIIGLMTTELSTLSIPKNVERLEVRSLSSTVNDLIPEIKKNGADIIVALTHQGVTDDSLLATQCPDLDVIVGGHTHTPLFRPKIVKGILIVQAGSRGRWLGKIDLVIDSRKDTVIQSTAELIECRTADIAPDPIVESKVNELEKLADKSLNEVIAEATVDLKRGGNSESNIGNWISDVMRAYAKTDIAFQNSGGIRKDILAGNVTVRDFWEISPFGNTLVTFSVDGKTVRSMIEHQLSLTDDFCQLSGLTYVYTVKAGEKKLHNVKIGTQLLDENKHYTIVTNNYVAAQAKKYFGIDLPESRITQLNVIDRDVLIDAAKVQKKITAAIENRVKEAEE